MPRTYAQAVAWQKAHPTRAGGATWAQWCAALVGWMVDGETFFPTANDARRASTIVSKNIYAAPAGAIHHWSDHKDGHTGVSDGHGAAHMASSTLELSFGIGTGIAGVEWYNRRHPDLTYEGWSWDWGGKRILGVTSAGAIGEAIIMAWTPSEDAKVQWLVDVTNLADASYDADPKRVAPLTALFRQLRDHVMPQVTAVWSWAHGWKYGEGDAAQDSPLAKLMRQVDTDPTGLATNADIQRLEKKIGAGGGSLDANAVGLATAKALAADESFTDAIAARVAELIGGVTFGVTLGAQRGSDEQ